MKPSLEIARAEAEDGMRRALDHAESKLPTWGDQALAFLEAYAKKQDVFPGWFVTRQAELLEAVPTPPTMKAWGNVFRRAVRLGYIKRTGYRADPNRHASPCPEWTSLIYRVAA